MRNSSYDVVIAGAGPAGLSLAAAFSGARLRIALVERAPSSELANPQFDGREIALTQASIQRLQRLGAWQRLTPSEIAPLLKARVHNGASPFALNFVSRRRDEPIGALVPNCAIRRVLFETVREQTNCITIDGHAVASIRTDAAAAHVVLADGDTLDAQLAVAADTRFSSLRQSQGITARMFDFGRSMLVCRMEHTRAHNQVATEWFAHGQTIAMLPLNGAMSSFVLTLPMREMDALAQLSPGAFAAEAQRRTLGRWGAMKVASARHVYPLVAVYANRFVAQRFALMGDAAVGMHPVTAHGYNFGLRGATTLAAEILRSARDCGDVGRMSGLQRYERSHRRATLPLFEATNALARLYSDERALPRMVRAAGLRLMAAVAPVRHAVEASLSA